MFTPKLPPGPVGTVDARRPGPARPRSASLAPVTGGVADALHRSRRSSARRRSPRSRVTGNPPATTVDGRRPRPGAPRTRSRCRPPTAAGPVRSRRASNAVTPTAPTAPGAPTGVVASAGNQPGDRALDRADRRRRARSRATRSRRTSAASRRPRPTVTGSPAPTTAVVPGLTNGTSYTFTVSGDELGRHRARLGAVQRRRRPSAVAALRAARVRPQHVRRDPAADADVGDHDRRPDRRDGRRVERRQRRRSPASPTRAGNTYTKVTSVKASERHRAQRLDARRSPRATARGRRSR